jgi:hypothetical protein
MKPARTADIAVVIPTVCRDTLKRAVESVFAQCFAGTVQVLVGVDVDLFGHGDALRHSLEAHCPSHIILTWLDLGYSTSRRHGGVHSCQFGGALRSILTLCAQSETVTYLDDDDWYEALHLDRIKTAIHGKHWAYSLCWYADSDQGRSLCVDEIESVGPDRGIYKKFGGFVRPSALAINKLLVPHVIPAWAHSVTPNGDGEDRLVFDLLRRVTRFGSTGRPTVCYALDPRDGMHQLRVEFLKLQGVTFDAVARRESVRESLGA